MIRPHSKAEPHAGEEGYFLVGLVVVCFLLLLVLGVAAPRIAKQLEREREVESEHRAQEYVRAIQLYYRKNGRYPTSMDQLTGSSASGFSSALNVKYLRQKYMDPLTHDEYRLIHQGEAKTEVKGFFGEPLQGIAAGNLGSAAGSASNLSGTPGPLSGGSPGPLSGGSPGPLSGGSPGQAGSPGGASQGLSLGNSSSGGAGGFGSGSQTFGPSSTFGSTGSGSSFGSGPAGGMASAGSSGGTVPTGSGGTGSGTGTGSSTPGRADATSFQGSKGAIVGVASKAKGHGLVEWNGSENIEQWEFLYDPRVELLKAKVSLFGGSPAASGSGSLGSGFKPADGSTGLGLSQSGGTNGSPGTNGFGTTPSFGSTGASGASSGNAGSGSATPTGTSIPAGPQAPAP